MNLKEIADKADGVDKKVLELIDLKTNQDMKEVISKIELLEHKIENNIKTVYWVVAIVGTVMSILLAIIALKK